MKIKTYIYLFLVTLLFPIENLFSQNAFMENRGQWREPFLYKKNLTYGAAFFFNDSIVYNFVKREDVAKSHAHNEFTSNFTGILHLHSFVVEFLNKKDSCRIVPTDKRDDYLNFFIGNNPKKWKSHVPHYNELSYKNVFKDVNINFYSDGNTIKYEYIALNSKAVRNIKYKIKYANKVELNKEGDLIIHTSVNTITEPLPYAYQMINGERVQIGCKYVLKKNNIVEFQVYNVVDKKLPIIIDPYLIFSTYSGSTADNWGFTATYDSKNNVYSGGIVFSTGYPTSQGAFQVNFAGGHGYSSGYYQYGCDIGIIKYNEDGTQRLYATYLGGANSEELPHSLVVDKNDNLIVMGVTGSTDFPITNGAYDNSFNGGDSVVYDNVIVFQNGTDIYVAKISEDGANLLSSTYIGGSANDGFNFRNSYGNSNFIMGGADTSLYYNYADGARGEVTVDDSDYVYIASTTFSADFPEVGGFSNGYRGKQEGIALKLSPDFSSLVWSGYISGNDDDALYSVDLANNGDVYVAGGTKSTNLPVMVNSYHSYFSGKVDGYIACIKADGSTLNAITYYGTQAYDQIYFVRVDKQNHPYVAGQTEAGGNAFIHNVVYSNPNSGQFISKFTPLLDSLIWSTAIGSGNGRPNISLTAFEIDVCNRIYLSGWGREWAISTTSWDTIQGTKNMPITSNAYRDSTDGQDFYLMVMDGDATYLDYATYFGEYHYSSCGYSGHDHVDGGTSRFNKRGNICQAACASCGGCQHFPTYPNNVWSTSNNASNCNNAVFEFSFVDDIVTAEFNVPHICPGDTIHFQNNSHNAVSYSWNFGDGTPLDTNASPSHYYSTPGTYTVMLVASNSGSCNMKDTIYREITIPEPLNITTSVSPMICGNMGSAEVNVTGTSLPVTYQWSNGATTSNISNVQAGTYILTITDANNCPVVLQVNVPDSSYNVSLSGEATNQPCTGKCLGTASVELSGFHNPYSLMWNTGDTSTHLTNLCEGDYSVTVVDENGCADTLNLHVGNDHIEPGINVWSDTNNVYPGTEVHVFANDSNIFNYQWYPLGVSGGNSSNITVYPTSTQTYTVYAWDSNGCASVDSITIRVREIVCGEPYIYIPNAFSPNGDGKNDILYVYANPALVKNMHLMIFDRWGELIFETTDLNHGWDGTFKGKILDPAVFVYYLEVTCINDEKFIKKGNITLLK